MAEKKRIAVLVSGGGTNLQALIDAQNRGENPNGEIVLVIASNEKAYALRRAENAGIKHMVLSRKALGGAEAFDNALLKVLEEERIDLVVLAGFLSILGQKVTDAYARRIINVHPALIPSFCGEGFYGLKVHEAALSYGVKVTGATVHFVNEIPDGGQIILQKAVDILPEDTAETLQKRVMVEAEWIILPKAVAMWCSGEIS
ncbi:MAG: phosphoribosylglycinamide formyltransferase [Oscillospiraceae bacterium]|nr:phosphoribosylglycinamide formyltransferase [Oscillospiraceae bacterium]